jgi:hypothetical protein
MTTEVQKEHEWLQQWVGEWAYECECVMKPGKPPETFKGSESVRTLGGFWVLCDGRGEMPGGGMAAMLMTLGYDSRQQRFVGSWAGSMMGHLWVYDGSLDAQKNVLTLNTEGPCCASDGKLVKQRDIIEVKNADRRLLNSYLLGEDGEWQLFMTTHYQRIK